MAVTVHIQSFSLCKTLQICQWFIEDDRNGTTATTCTYFLYCTRTAAINVHVVLHEEEQFSQAHNKHSKSEYAFPQRSKSKGLACSAQRQVVRPSHGLATPQERGGTSKSGGIMEFTLDSSCMHSQAHCTWKLSFWRDNTIMTIVTWYHGDRIEPYASTDSQNCWANSLAFSDTYKIHTCEWPWVHDLFLFFTRGK